MGLGWVSPKGITGQFWDCTEWKIWGWTNQGRILALLLSSLFNFWSLSFLVYTVGRTPVSRRGWGCGEMYGPVPGTFSSLFSEHFSTAECDMPDTPWGAEEAGTARSPSGESAGARYTHIYLIQTDSPGRLASTP